MSENLNAAKDKSSAGPADPREANKPEIPSLEGYFNNPTFSDITIHYGPHGEETFHGHKIILVSKSAWFRAAFTTEQFKESQDEEITLHDDDPIAIKNMLKFFYSGEYNSGVHPAYTVKSILEAVSTYCVADKYLAPQIKDKIMSDFQGDMESWVDRLQKHDVARSHTLIIQELKEIVEHVYRLTPEHERQGLRSDLVGFILTNQDMTIIGNRGKFSHVPSIIAKMIPEFGRDLWTELVDIRGGWDPGVVIYGRWYCKICDESTFEDIGPTCSCTAEDSD